MNLNYLWITDASNPIFTTLFKEYFIELGINLKDDSKLWDEMNNDIKLFGIKTIVLLDNENVVGFSMFQIDTQDNPWCMYDGAGDIREFYVKSEYRQKGYGTHMFNFIKEYFNKLDIRDIYLTSSEDDGEAFWIKQGFQDTGIVNSKNKLKEFVYNLS